jgi:hypothetical protein
MESFIVTLSLQVVVTIFNKGSYPGFFYLGSSRKTDNRTRFSIFESEATPRPSFS